MLRLYSCKTDRSDLCSIRYSPKDGLVRVPYKGILTERKPGKLDDEMHDWLTAFVLDGVPTENDELLIKADYDLNIDNWAVIRCIYLPFLHFLYMPEGWIIQ